MFFTDNESCLICARLRMRVAVVDLTTVRYSTQNRHPVGLTPLESTGNVLIAIPMKRYILRAFTRLALVWTLRRPATMLFRSFLTLRDSQSRQIEQYLSNLRRVLRGRSAMGKTRKLLCNKILMVKGVGFEYSSKPSPCRKLKASRRPGSLASNAPLAICSNRSHSCAVKKFMRPFDDHTSAAHRAALGTRLASHDHWLVGYWETESH
jgi:hypothetical protein